MHNPIPCRPVICQQQHEDALREQSENAAQLEGTQRCTPSVRKEDPTRLRMAQRVVQDLCELGARAAP